MKIKTVILIISLFAIASCSATNDQKNANISAVNANTDKPDKCIKVDYKKTKDSKGKIDTAPDGMVRSNIINLNSMISYTGGSYSRSNCELLENKETKIVISCFNKEYGAKMIYKLTGDRTVDVATYYRSGNVEWAIDALWYATDCPI